MLQTEPIVIVSQSQHGQGLGCTNLADQITRVHYTKSKIGLLSPLIQSRSCPGSRVSFYTGTGNDVPRLVTNLTDFFEENKDFLLIL